MKATIYRPIRVLFAGGCHVIGYPVGEDRSFAAVACQFLEKDGIAWEVRHLSYLKTTQAARVAAECATVPPDIIVFQLGHFELSRRLSIYLRKMAGLAAKTPPSSKSSASARSISNPSIFYWKAAAKALVDRLLGHPLVDLSAFEKDLRSMAASFSHGPRVVLLSPLPCADPLSLYYRLAARPIFERVARDYDFTFIDALADRPGGRQRHFGSDEFYFDAVHLGADGHLGIGRSVGAALAAIHLAQSVESRA